MKKRVQELFSEMREEVLLANIQASSYDSILLLIPVMKPKRLTEVGEKLIAIYHNEYKAVKDARGQVSPEIWHNYELMGVTGLWEQDNLAQAISVFRKTMRRFIHEATQPKRDPEASRSVKNRRKSIEPNVGSSSE